MLFVDVGWSYCTSSMFLLVVLSAVPTNRLSECDGSLLAIVKPAELLSKKLVSELENQLCDLTPKLQVIVHNKTSYYLLLQLASRSWDTYKIV
jgi:hypothetical protein